MLNPVLIGDKSLTSNKFHFSILNLKEFHGDAIHYPGTNIKARGRITLENAAFKINLDKAVDYKTKSLLLDDSGGYQILYNGEIIINKGGYTHEQVNNIMNILGNFLSFINGKKTFPLFLTALHDGNIIYKDYNIRPNDMHDNISSWSSPFETESFNDLFKAFYDLWQSNQENKNFLVSTIHWYTLVNLNKADIEGSLVIAQTTLELLYNWLIIEQRKLIKGKEGTDLSASNKIRLLISHLSITYDIPSGFRHLIRYSTSNKNDDAIDAIVQIRNAIVHSQEKKRKNLPDKSTMHEALQLSIWYIETVILFILKFNGKYLNRCVDARHYEEGVETPPWTSSNH